MARAKVGLRKRPGIPLETAGRSAEKRRTTKVKEEEEEEEAAEEMETEDMDGDLYYEYEEGVAEEERGSNRRFDDVELAEYELPSDFEDEEIDEDAAFGSGEAEEEGGVERQAAAAQEAEEVDLFGDEENEGDEEEEDEDEDEDEEEEDEDENDDRKRRRLVEDVTRMAAAAGAPAERGERRGWRRVLKEAYPESEFNLNSSGGVTVEDLMAPLRDQSGFGALRKRMTQLERQGGPVDVPLPRVVRDRLSRKAGYETTTLDVTKWQDTVKANREAATRSFVDRGSAAERSGAPLSAEIKPATDFEKAIRAVLREGKQDAQNVAAAEAPELNKLTVEEVRERQERLARMRHLLFRHEEKAKRVRKIKSKTFHRLLQKGQRSKALSAAGEADPEADPEAAKAAVLKLEFDRARERMTLKHRNSSRWAKRILKRGLKGSDTGGRDAIAEQLQTHAALTRKIQSADDGESDASSGDSEDEKEDDAGGNGNSRSKLLAKAKVATLKALEDGDEGEELNTGLFALPFMAKAIEKKRKSAQNEAMKVLQQLEEAEEDGDLRGLDEDAENGRKGQVQDANPCGRISFAAGKGAVVSTRRDAAADSDEEPDEEPDEDSGNESSEDLAERPGRRKDSLQEDRSHAEAGKRSEAHEGLQWEAPQSNGTHRNGRVSSVGVETVPAKEVKQVAVIVAGSQKLPQSRIDASVEEARVPEEGRNPASNGQKLTQSPFSDEDSDANVREAKDAGNDQQKWIKEAFAGDDVEAEFEKVKSQVLQEEVPREEGPLSLPGWGQWTSVQRKSGQPKWLLAEQAALEKKRQRGVKNRKDAHLKHVIISEKTDKKAAKFTTASLPYPYSSREVFEGSIRMPIGREYNTDKAYRNMIGSSVVKRTGQIIDPITLDKSAVKQETEATAQVGKEKGGKGMKKGIKKGVRKGVKGVPSKAPRKKSKAQVGEGRQN